ncbi:MAG: ion transporter [Lachnospiraceae bacterium]|nr:ion transporter [Lachnospiraceae bacterium]
MGKGVSKKDKIGMRLFQIVEVGYTEDLVSRLYDYAGVCAIFLNLTASVLFTFDNARIKYGSVLLIIEAITVFFFTADYVLRLITAKYKFRDRSLKDAVLSYIFSFTGIIDLLSFLPYFLPIFFPEGTVAFRMFRIVRILRLFRLNAYYDSLNVITNVIKSKRQQLLSSMFIIFVLMLASSLCMYSVEHEAQPEVFSNAFSGIWWAASALLTVGYGDIYPITYAGRVLGTVIAFLGVGVVAVPTGIISAGFVEQYALLKQTTDSTEDMDIHFIRSRLDKNEAWTGKRIKDLMLPKDLLVVGIERGNEFIMPSGDTVLYEGDVVIMASERYKDDWKVELKEIMLKYGHPWCDRRIKELDISRKAFIVMVRRNDSVIIPRGDLKLKENDVIVIYTDKSFSEASVIRI